MQKFLATLLQIAAPWSLLAFQTAPWVISEESYSSSWLQRSLRNSLFLRDWQGGVLAGSPAEPHGPVLPFHQGTALPGVGLWSVTGVKALPVLCRVLHFTWESWEFIAGSAEGRSRKQHPSLPFLHSCGWGVGSCGSWSPVPGVWDNFPRWLQAACAGSSVHCQR